MALPQAALEQLAFPVLGADQIARLRPFAKLENTNSNDVLFEAGQANYNLIVVLKGTTNIVDRANGDHVLKASGPGQFNGELGLLNGQRAFAACIVDEPGQVLLLPPAAVQEIIASVPDISNIFVTAFAARRQLLMANSIASVTIIGSANDAAVMRLLAFVDRNRIPYRLLDPHNPKDTSAIATCGFPDGDEFRAVLGGQRVLEQPSPLDLAQAVGLDLTVRQDEPCDLIVVGAGPAGLAAAVLGASEGLSTFIVEDTAVGGQAGTSSCIENYVGFPAGISGGDLAFRAEVQANKFGAHVTVPRSAIAVERCGTDYAVRLDDGSVLRGRSIVIATGARYRRLNLTGQEAFEGAGIYYAATELEARHCRGQEVIVVGGGNSAGQAVMFLSRHASCVHLLCRGADLAGRMSRYLITRLEHTPNVVIELGSRVTHIQGSETLERVTVANASSGQCRELRVAGLFVMIGAEPCTDWLQGTVALDEKGFIQCGSHNGQKSGSLSPVSPYLTTLPGVFAIGDVRSGSVKRVASAVGEGSVVVQAVHHYLAGLREAESAESSQ